MEYPDIYYMTEGIAWPVGFKIYYGDWSVVSATGNSGQLRSAFNRARKDNVQIILIFEQTLDSMVRPTRVCISGRDYYWYDGTNERITATNDPNSYPKNSYVLFGAWMEDADWFALSEVAFNDYTL